MSSSSMIAPVGRTSRQRRRRRLAVLIYLALHVAAAPFNIASARDSSRASLSVPENPWPGSQQETDVWIDAFDMRTCGDAEFRPWQEAQSASGCAGPLPPNEPLDAMGSMPGSGGNGSRIFGGMDAFEGEFPSYVHINVSGVFGCGATLIDKDLVVTAAHCLDMPSKRTLIFGSNWLSGTGGEVRQVTKWCYPSVSKSDRSFKHDLAIVRFEEPIVYVPKKIWPACVNLNMRHLDTAKCAYAGLGSTDDFNAPPVAKYLKTLPVERACRANTEVESCYLASDDKTHGARGGDSGTPIYCYDRCDGMSREKVQAFAVAAHSGRPGTRNNMQTADFNLLKYYFLDMLKMIRLEGTESSDEIVCKVA